jgi:hypothetical protein
MVLADDDRTQARRRSQSSSQRISDLMNAPSSAHTAVGTDSAWALKLKAAVDSAVRELDVQVLSAKPICTYNPDDPNDMLFEMETERGRLHAMRSRAGEHSFHFVDTQSSSGQP